MPKSGDNARPYSRSQKASAKKDKRALSMGTKAGLGKFNYSGTGPGRMHNSAGVAAQATRSLAGEASKKLAQRMSVRGGAKPRTKK